MTTRHYALPVETTRWFVEGTTETAFNWEYDEPRDQLLTLYEKGKRKQWDAQTLIDWSLDFDIADQGVLPDMYVPIFGSPWWERMSRAEQDELRHHYAAWLNSQFLHGEQGALICAAKIVQTVPDVDSKFYAATQVMDEARHVEAYNKFLLEKLQLAYPIHPQLALLLEQTIADSRWDITYLGMQVMIEGVALAAFSLIRDFTEHPLSRSLNAYVMKDEARHVAFGLLALQDAYQDLTEAERREREEFVIEAARLLRDRIVAGPVYENLGLTGRRVHRIHGRVRDHGHLPPAALRSGRAHRQADRPVERHDPAGVHRPGCDRLRRRRAGRDVRQRRARRRGAGVGHRRRARRTAATAPLPPGPRNWPPPSPPARGNPEVRRSRPRADDNAGDGALPRARRGDDAGPRPGPAAPARAGGPAAAGHRARASSCSGRPTPTRPPPTSWAGRPRWPRPPSSRSTAFPAAAATWPTPRRRRDGPLPAGQRQAE